MTYRQPLVRRLAALVLLVGGLALMAAVWAPAQDEPAPDTPFDQTVVQPETKMTLWQLIAAGGWTMFPLGAFSIVAVALIVRNFIVLKDDKLLRPDLVPILQQGMANRDIPAVLALCRQQPCLLTAVLSAGLDRVMGEELVIEHVKEAVEESGTEQTMTYMTPVTYLANIGALAPMLGLLGTVSGMIKAFQNIAGGGMGKAELLAKNIGEALITTATGLIIAIFAMLFYFYFKNRFMKIMASLGRMSGSLLDCLHAGALPSGWAGIPDDAAPTGESTEDPTTD